MDKYGTPTQTLSEGIYKIEEGYEYVGTYNGNIIIQKKPDFKEYDFVAFEDGWFGILKKYQYDNKGAFYIDFHLYKDSFGKYSIGFFQDRVSVCCENMRLATEEEKELIMDVLHAFGKDYRPDEYHKFINYIPNNYSYGLSIKEGKFVATKIDKDNIGSVLDERYRTYKFETERAAKICADILNEKIKR